MKQLEQKLKDLPHKSGVYIMYNEARQILYIGKARDLFKRVHQYFGNKANRTVKVIKLVEKIVDLDYIITSNEVEALVLENNLIKKHKPPYNILLKDDKSYPFIKIDVKKPFPRVEVVRKLKNDGAKYFGPYMQGISTQDILGLINSAFCVRSCKTDLTSVSKNHRPCLNYHIKRCSAPCAGLISREEYDATIKEIISFLQGNDKKIAEVLTSKMKEASDREEYELALMYKQKLQVLTDVFAVASNGLNTVAAVIFVRGGKIVGGDKQIVDGVSLDESSALSNFILRFYDMTGYIASEVVTSIQIEDSDVLGEYLSERAGKKINVIYPHQGVRRQLADMALGNAQDYLEKSISLHERKENMTMGGVIQLAEYLHLSKLPVRMECYDISHISGTNKVASMVVFIDGAPERSHYRKFKIETVEGNDDFACLRETLRRRLADIKDRASDVSFSSRPDLIIIDGGKGQLSSVMDEVADCDTQGINFISLAKREEEVFLPGQSAPVILPRDSYALKLLQRIRDEAHRFAITFHRNLRKKSQTRSTLLSIDGVGEKRVKVLFEAFRTLDNIKKASVDEMTAIKGMDRRTAENVYAAFHEGDE